MNDISSISFTQSSVNISPFTSKSATIQLNSVLNQLGSVLQTVRDFSDQANDLYQRMASLVRQTHQKIELVKKQNIQAHRKCLQHIQILLFQKDYSEALAKIDRYKKVQLTDLSFQQQINLKQKNKQMLVEQFTFQQAKALINNQFLNFELKQQIWLQYALNQQQDPSSLRHVTYQQIQNAQIQNFKKQFSIMSEITQVDQKQNNLVSTPQKLNSRSVGILKSQVKKHKNSHSVIKNVYHQKSAGKLGSGMKKSSQKRTTRKKVNKQSQQNKTSKKVVTSFVA